MNSDGRMHLGWAVGQDNDGRGTVLRTRNGGQQWEKGYLPGMFEFSNPSRVDAVSLSCVWLAVNVKGTGYILCGTADKQDWRIATEALNLVIPELYGLSALDERTLCAVGAEGTILVTHDAGKSWLHPISIPKVHLQGVRVVSKNVMWASGDVQDGHAVLLLSINGGKDWKRVGDQPGSGVPDTHMLAMAAFDEIHAWAVGGDYSVIYTESGGALWLRQKAPEAVGYDANDIYLLPSGLGWIPDDFAIAATKDGGRTSWESQDYPGGGYLLSVSGVDEKNLWIVGMTGGGTAKPLGFGHATAGPSATRYSYVGMIFHTENGGGTWIKQVVEGKADIPIGLCDCSFISVVTP